MFKQDHKIIVGHQEVLARLIAHLETCKYVKVRNYERTRKLQGNKNRFKMFNMRFTHWRDRKAVYEGKSYITAPCNLAAHNLYVTSEHWAATNPLDPPCTYWDRGYGAQVDALDLNLMLGDDLDITPDDVGYLIDGRYSYQKDLKNVTRAETIDFLKTLQTKKD